MYAVKYRMKSCQHALYLYGTVWRNVTLLTFCIRERSQLPLHCHVTSVTPVSRLGMENGETFQNFPSNESDEFNCFGDKNSPVEAEIFERMSSVTCVFLYRLSLCQIPFIIHQTKLPLISK